MSILDSAELLLQAKNYSGTGDWLDESGNGHDAQPGSAAGADTNDPLFKEADDGQYLYIESPSGNYVSTTIPANADIDVGDLATFAAWVRPTRVSSNVTLLDARSASGYQFRRAGASDDKPSLSLDDGPTLLSVDHDVATSQDDWHHIVATVDHTGAVDEANIWLDGVASVNNPVDISTLGNIAADLFRIGHTSGGFSLRCDVIVLEMYKDLATDAEIATVFGSGVGSSFVGLLSDPVAVVNFADTAMVAEPFAVFTDPQSNAWTFFRSATGLVATVVDRDQWLYTTDDYHEITDAAGLDFAAAEALTAMVVFRTNTVAAGDDVLLAKKDNLTTSAGYALVRSTATGQFIVADGTLDDDDTAGTVAVRTLTSLAGVRDIGADDLEAFLGGVGSGSPTTDSTTATLANAFPIRVGATSNTAANFHEGQIMAVALWRRALNAAEIAEAHDLLTSGVARPVAQLRGSIPIPGL